MVIQFTDVGFYSQCVHSVDFENLVTQFEFGIWISYISYLVDFVLGKGQVIKGWDEGVSLLNVGTKAKLIIPPDLGYGKRGAGRVIPPDATLIFDVELMEIK